MFTISALRPLAFIFTALHPNNVYVSAHTLETACKRGNMTLVTNAMLAQTCCADIIAHCDTEERLLDYVHDVEQMVGVRVDARIEALGLAHALDYADEIIGRIYMMNMIIIMQESNDMTKHARIVCLNVMRTLAQGLQSLVADAEGCDWTK